MMEDSSEDMELPQRKHNMLLLELLVGQVPNARDL